MTPRSNLICYFCQGHPLGLQYTSYYTGTETTTERGTETRTETETTTTQSYRTDMATAVREMIDICLKRC